MGYNLSPTMLGLMNECPRCFWLHYNKCKKRPEGIFPSLPNGMDRILKIHFDKFRDRGELPPELKEDEECKNCRLFENKKQLDLWRNRKDGILWEDEEGNILRGLVDNILVKNNKLIVLDYKTRGFPLKENTHEYYQDQMNLYNFLLRMNGYKTEDFAFLLFYVPKEVKETGEVIFDTTLVKIKTSADEAEKLFRNAIKLLKGPCPKKEDCEWCRLIDED